MKVSELGEFGLIGLLSDLIATSNSSRGEPARQIVVGLGDDTAAWYSPALELATTDTLVQGVHFTLNTITWKELGWKALAVNLSDIAAMGGVPAYALTSLALPADTEVEDVIQLYQGMIEVANKFDTLIVGGNITHAPLVVITITLTGSGIPGHLLRRSAAVPGDVIAVTGYLGTSAAGREMLSQELSLDPDVKELLREAHLQPCPRIVAGQLLARHGVQAAIDISDGLIADLVHICEASKVGARIRVDQVPVHPAVSTIFEKKSLTFALAGGEDYELLFTGSTAVIEKVKAEADCPITVIGEITAEAAGQVTLVDAEGISFSLSEKGWEHFVS
jgi:thiamine-monophosphate kinase